MAISSDRGFEIPAFVSRETLGRLEDFASELQKWSAAINLIAKTTLADLWRRHILDSLQLDAIPDLMVSRWCDLGTGGGFPGLVLALSGKETRPDCHYTLLESDARKAAFLQLQCQRHDLNATVIAARIEAAPRQSADVISARALAGVPKLLEYALRHQAQSAVVLLLKGRTFQEELDQAKRAFAFRHEIRPSATSEDGAVLVISELTQLRRHA